MRRRNVRTSVRPSRSPRTSTSPTLGCSCSAAIRTIVLLPDPFGPSTTHRSWASTHQFTGPRIVRSSRVTLTPESRRGGGVKAVQSARIDIALGFGVIALLILANGFFVAAELALVAVERDRVEALAEQGSR